MRKRWISLILALALCLTLAPGEVMAAGEPRVSRKIRGAELVTDTEKNMAWIQVDEYSNLLSVAGIDPPREELLPVTLIGDGKPFPYCLSLDQTATVLEDVRVELPYDSMDGTISSFDNGTLTLRGDNTLTAQAGTLRLGGVELRGPGSLTLSNLLCEMSGLHMAGGSLNIRCQDLGPHKSAVLHNAEGAIRIDGGSLTVIRGDYANMEDENLLVPAGGAISLENALEISGGKIFLDGGTDLRTGELNPCITISGGGSVNITGGVFNIGDLDANTVLGVPVAPGCVVENNPDPATRQVYPYRVSQAAMPLAVYPRNGVANPGKTFQMNAVGTQAASAVWSLTGNQKPGTAISETGLLTVAGDETAQSLTVEARAAGQTVRTEVRLEKETVEIWLLCQQWFGRGFTVLEHSRIEKGKSVTFPKEENIPGFSHVGWYDLEMNNTYEIGDPIPTGEDMVFWTQLDKRHDEFVMCGRLYQVPAIGRRLNSSGGSEEAGSWWVERPTDTAVEVTLNGVDFSQPEGLSIGNAQAQIQFTSYYNLTVYVRGENRIVAPALEPGSLKSTGGIRQDRRDGSCTIDLAAGSTLTLRDRPEGHARLLGFGEDSGSVRVRGQGSLKLEIEGPDSSFLEGQPKITVENSARVELIAHENGESNRYALPDLNVQDTGSLVIRRDGCGLSQPQSSRNLMGAGISIVGSLYSDGRQARSLTTGELLAQLNMLEYVKISADPAPPHVDSYPIWLGGVQVTADNQGDILGDGTAAFNPSSMTLTLQDADIRAPGGGDSPALVNGLMYRFSTSPRPLTIENSGHSAIRGSMAADAAGAVLEYRGDLRLAGSGTLEISGHPEQEHSVGLRWLPEVESKLMVKGDVVLALRGRERGISITYPEDVSLDTGSEIKILGSTVMEGTNPEVLERFRGDLPYTAVYTPMISSIFFRSLSGLEQPMLYPVQMNQRISFLIRCKDQFGYNLGTQSMLDELRWSFSEEMSSSNVVGKLNSWGDLRIDPYSGEITCTWVPEPCYIGVEVRSSKTGAKEAIPALIFPNSALESIEVRTKPGYEDKIYREGDVFNPNSVEVVRHYAGYPVDSPTVRHENIFLTSDGIFPTEPLKKGQQTVSIGFWGYPITEDNATAEYPVTVIGGSFAEEVPDQEKILVTSDSACTLVIAAYDQNGRMESARSYPIPAKTVEKAFAFPAGSRAFLLDEAWAPISKAVGGLH